MPLLAARASRRLIRPSPGAENPATDTPGSAFVYEAATGLDPGSITLAIGATFQLAVSATDAGLGPGSTLTGFTESWSSADTGIATVNSSGLVTAVGAGTLANLIRCQVTKNSVSAIDSIDGTITVSAPTVVTVSRTPSTLAGTAGGTFTITYQARDGSGNAITGKTYTATSDATGVAVIDSVTGNVASGHFVANGTANITGHCDGVDSSVTAITVATTTNNRPAGLTTKAVVTSNFASETLDARFSDPSPHGQLTFQGPDIPGGAEPMTTMCRSLAAQASWRPPGVTAFPAHPLGLDRVIATEFGGATIAPNEKGMFDFSQSGMKSQYHAVWFLVYSSFYGNGTASNKIGYERNSGGGALVHLLNGVGMGTLKLTPKWQGRYPDDIKDTVGNECIITRNTWYFWECVPILETTVGAVGVPQDGSLTYYLNGTRVFQRLDAAYGVTSFTGYQQLMFHGGTGTSTPPGGVRQGILHTDWEYAYSTSKIANPP